MRCTVASSIGKCTRGTLKRLAGLSPFVLLPCFWTVFGQRTIGCDADEVHRRSALAFGQSGGIRTLIATSLHTTATARGTQRIVLARLGFDLWRTSHDTYYGLLGASRAAGRTQGTPPARRFQFVERRWRAFCGPWKQMTSAVEELCLGPSWIWSGSAYSYCGPGRFVQMPWSQLYLKAENGGLKKIKKYCNKCAVTVVIYC